MWAHVRLYSLRTSQSKSHGVSTSKIVITSVHDHIQQLEKMKKPALELIMMAAVLECMQHVECTQNSVRIFGGRACISQLTTRA